MIRFILSPGSKFNNYALLRSASIIILLTLIHSVSFSQKQYDRFRENSRYGLKSEKGKQILAPNFESLGWSDGSFEVIDGVTGYLQKGLWGIISVSGEIRIPAKYQRLQLAGSKQFIEAGLVQSNGHYREGIIDLQGKVIFPFDFERATLLREKIIYRSGKSFGLANLRGEILLKPEWRSIQDLDDRYSLVENENEKKALFDWNGYPKSGFVLDSAGILANGDLVGFMGPQVTCISQGAEINELSFYKAVRLNDQQQTEVLLFNDWIIYDSANQIIGSIKADSIKFPDRGMIRIFRNGWKAEIENDLKEPPAGNFSSEIQSSSSFLIKKEISGYGIADEFGNVRVAANYEHIDWDGKSAILTTCAADGHCRDQITFPADEFKTTPAVDRIIRLKNFFKIYNFGRYGLWDSVGREILPAIYDSVLNVKGQLILVKYLGRTGLMTLAQQWIVAPQFAPVTIVDEQRYIIHKIGEQTLYDISGKRLYRSAFELTLQPDGSISEFIPGGSSKCLLPDGNICLLEGNKNAELKGKASKLKIDQTKFSDNSSLIFQFIESEGLKGFFGNGKFGFKDTKGRIRIANRYDSIRPFKEGRAAVKLLGKWGFIDNQDHLHVQPLYQEVTDFKDGLAMINLEGKWGMIDETGTLKLQPDYDQIDAQPSSSFSIVRKSNQFGLVSKNGQLMIEPRFESLIPTFKNQILVKNYFYGVITTQGIPIIPLIHRNLKWFPGSPFYLSEKLGGWELLQEIR